MTVEHGVLASAEHRHLRLGNGVTTQSLAASNRAIRIVLGMVLIAFAGMGPKTIWGLLGIYPIITARLGWCPFSRLMNLALDVDAVHRRTASSRQSRLTMTR